MDERPETISTAEILLAVLVALFGQKTVRVKMWRGQGNTDPCVPAGYLATDRLGKHPDTPVNRLTAERVVEMAGIALRGESDYDRCATSRQIGRVLHELFGVAAPEFVIGEADSGEVAGLKAAAQLAFLRQVMSVAVGRRDVGVERMASSLRGVAAFSGDSGKAEGACGCRHRCAYPHADVRRSCDTFLRCSEGCAACGRDGAAGGAGRFENQQVPPSPAMTSDPVFDSLFSKGIPDDEEVMTLEDALRRLLAAVEPPPGVEFGADSSFCLEVRCEEPLEWARRAFRAAGPTGTTSAGSGGCGSGGRDGAVTWGRPGKAAGLPLPGALPWFMLPFRLGRYSSSPLAAPASSPRMTCSRASAASRLPSMLTWV